MGFSFKSQVWDSGFGFKLIIHVEIQVWESGFRFWFEALRFGIKVWDSGLGFKFQFMFGI